MATYYVRTDGNDSNTGLGSTTALAWQTVSKAIGATGIAPGDTLYIAPGVYRGNFVCGFTNPSSNAQRITIAGNPTASLFTGITAGPIIITNFTGPTTASGLTFGATNKDYLSLLDLHFVGYQSGGSPAFGNVFFITGTYPIVNRCSFYTPVQSTESFSYYFNVPSGTRGPSIEDCVFYGHTGINATTATTSYDSQSLFRNCIFINGNTSPNTNSALRIDSGFTSATFGGVRVINCRFMAMVGIRPYGTLRISQTYPVVIQNCIFECPTGLQATINGDYVESYNVFNCSTERTNVATGTGSLSRAFISPDFSLSRLSGWANLPFGANHSVSASQNAGINTNSDTTDFYGVTWLAPSTPTMGPVEYYSNQAIGQYLPTERNASTITIAPGSTSQSIELYLGATGLTASTTGLSAYYNRTRSADVQISLVARTIEQAWVSGGFAEVNAITMPGVYRLDIPNAAISAGYTQTVVTVRGASGTNGAVVVIQEPPILGSQVRMGPFTVQADGVLTDERLKLFKGSIHSIDFKMVDQYGTGVDGTGTVVTANAYNSAGFLVDSYPCTAKYAEDGRYSFAIDATVTNVVGMYTINISRQIGSEINVFGRMKLEVLSP